MKHLMIDLETMGTKSNAAIVSIGAVFFEEGKGLGEEFYARINLQSAVDYGGIIDPSTIIWWLQQSEEARKEIYSPEETYSIQGALELFSNYAGQYRESKLECVWGNGADFDNIILGSAYERIGQKKPWSYAQNRCYRTLKDLFRGPIIWDKREGVHHNALDDAKYQAKHALRMLEVYNTLPEITYLKEELREAEKYIEALQETR